MEPKNNFRFSKWRIYLDSKKFARLNIDIVKRLPREYRYELGSQLIRSSTSVALNIAEGSGKYSDKDFKHYLNIATGSLFEIIATLDILRDFQAISNADFERILSLGDHIVGQLTGFKKRLGPC